MSRPRIYPGAIAQSFGVSLPPPVVAELDAIAKADDRSRSYVIRKAVEDYIAEHRSPAPGA